MKIFSDINKMDYNKRLIEVYLELKKEEKISTLKDFGLIICENSNGISDIKFERKSVTLNHLAILKERFQEVNIEQIVTGEGPILLSPDTNTSMNRIGEENRMLNQLKMELSKANLKINHLENTIKTKEEILQAREQMIELMKQFVKSPTNSN